MKGSDLTQCVLLFFSLISNECHAFFDEKDGNSCNIFLQDFTTVYNKYFELVNSLTITMLLVRQHFYITKDVTNDILKHITTNINTTIRLREKFLLSYPTSRKLKEVPPESRQPFEKNLKHPYNLNRARRITSEPSEGHMILAWDIDTLDTFLQSDKDQVILNPRATHAIFFLYNVPVCFDWRDELEELLGRLWKNYKVFQVVAQIPCSCNPNKVFIYNPFHVFENRTWGSVYDYSLSEIRNDLFLIVNSFYNMNRYPMRVSMFPRKGSAVTIIPKILRADPIYSNLSMSKGYGGIDGCLLASLSQHLNFETIIYPPKYDNFGTVLNNGTITGSLKDVATGTVDFSANGRFIVDYGTPDIEFTNTVMGDSICVVVPKSQQIPQWMVILKCFTLEVWLFILGVYIVVVMIYYASRPTELKLLNLSTAYFEIFGIYIHQSRNLKRVRGQYLLIGSLIIFSVIVWGIFQGSLTEEFGTISFYPDINSLEDLEKSTLTIKTSLTVLDHDQTELMKKLSHRKIYSPENALAAVAYGRDCATLERKIDAKLYINIYYMKDDVPLVHVMDECIITFFVAYIVPRGSPYLPILNHFIEIFFESGLTKKWHKDIIDGMIMEKVLSITKHTEIQNAFSLYDVQTCFFIWCLGILLATVVFICEVLYFKIIKS